MAGLVLVQDYISGMNRRACLALIPFAAAAEVMAAQSWPIHSMDRPQPAIVRVARLAAVAPPSDAIVLFDGSSLAEWRSSNGDKPAPWKVADGYMEVVPGSGGILTARGLGSVQLHVEW